MKKILIYSVLLGFLVLAGCGTNKTNTTQNTDNGWNISSDSVFSSDFKEEDIDDKDVKDVVNEEKKIENDKTEEELEKDIVTKDKEENNKTKVKKLALSDVDLDSVENPRDCLKIKFKKLSYKKECVKYVENKILNSLNLSALDCKKLVFRKSKLTCFDKVYFKLAKDKKKEKYCKLIKNEQIRSSCLKGILDYKKSLQEVAKKQELQKKQEQVIKNKVESLWNVKECKNLKEWKIQCIEKFVKQGNDMRYCDLLTWKEKNICINNNWNDVLKYNLKKAVQTKDKSYCDKIWNQTWVKRCYAGIK